MNLKKKLNLDYWKRKIFVSKIYQKFFNNKKNLNREIFTSIYKSGHWVRNQNNSSQGKISISGPGSNLGTDQFYDLKDNMNKILEKYRIESILDMPCGDFLWINEVIKNKNIDYLGIDIVDELIEKNISKYQNKKTNFQVKDIVEYSHKGLVDLVLIRDLFIHISNKDIAKIIKNLKDFDFKYLAVNCYSNENNKDVATGQHRKVNLLIPPFNLPKPIYSFKDYENDKFVFLYEKKQI
jgi:SAM-dependent methyltransferase